MAKIESRTGKISSSGKKVFHFLSDFNNFEHLIPSESVKNWQSDGDSCSFSIDGLGQAGLRIVEKDEPKLIKIISEGQTPVSMTMWIQLKEVEENDTRIRITVDPQVNMMMMTMVKKPLKNFVDMLIDRAETMEF